MLHDPNKRKLESKTSNYMYLGYVKHNVAYRFLVLKSDVIEHNTIVGKIFLANIPLGMKPTPYVSIHYDCQSIIAIAKNKNYNGKNRHIQLRHNLVK